MSKINLWNTVSLAQTGGVKLLDSGRQLFGTVVKHGVNDKTVTVRVSSKYFNHKYKKELYSNKSKQVHDELNYCVTGDKVIIANCNQISSMKAYYVKSIVRPFGRPMTPKGQQTQAEQISMSTSAPVATSPADIQEEINKMLKLEETQMIKKSQAQQNNLNKKRKDILKQSKKLKIEQITDTHTFEVVDDKKQEKKKQYKKEVKKEEKKAQKKGDKQQKSISKPKKKFIDRRQKKADKLV